MSQTKHENQIDRMNQVSTLNQTIRMDSSNSKSNINQMNRKVLMSSPSQTNNNNVKNNMVQESTINKIRNMDRTDSGNSMICTSNTNYRVSRLSNQELELKLKDLVTRERSLLHVILEHIKEVATRRLYLERAYSSLFEYLVKELGYSGSAAMRRIEAARLLKEVPAVAQKIQEGSLNLSQIGELSRAIKEKEKTTGEKISVLRKEHLVAAISGMNTQETQKELCSALDIQIKEHEKQRVQKDDSVRLELTFSKEQYEKLSQCRDLLAHVLQQNQKDSSWASVMETLADQYLNKKRGVGRSQGTCVDTEIDTKTDTETDTEIDTNIKTIPNSDSKTDRNFLLEAVVAKTNSSSGKAPTMKPNADAKVTADAVVTADAATGCGNRHIRGSYNCGDRCRGSNDRRSRDEIPRTDVCKSLSPKMKVAVLKRDRCCQFVDPVTKKKCGTTFGLQIDHRTSRWADGDYAETNLQVLCQWHNRLKYKKESGIRFV